jgi:hypothetical protein
VVGVVVVVVDEDHLPDNTADFSNDVILLHGHQ